MNPSPELTKQTDQTAKENEVFRLLQEIDRSIAHMKIQRERKISELGELFADRLSEES